MRTNQISKEIDMKPSEEAVCYLCLQTFEMFIYTDPFGGLYYSTDGVKFFELKITGLRGNLGKFHVSFEDPSHNRKGGFEMDGEILVCDTKGFERIRTPKDIDVVPLPTVREPEYFFQLPDGTYIYVSRDKYKYSYETLKLFIGNLSEMKEISVIAVERYRDGGTTYIKTTQGVLYSPTPFDKKAKPKWNGVPIKEIKTTKFIIIEEGDTVKIQKK